MFSQETTESSSETTTTTTTAAATSTTTTTTEAPVVIVKQVNEINDDGSYTVGFEASDGSFRLETKDAEGNVEGKYGFLDENGEIKIVEYSANNSTGFQSDLELPSLPVIALGGLLYLPSAPIPHFGGFSAYYARSNASSSPRAKIPKNALCLIRELVYDI